MTTPTPGGYPPPPPYPPGQQPDSIDWYSIPAPREPDMHYPAPGAEPWREQAQEAAHMIADALAVYMAPEKQREKRFDFSWIGRMTSSKHGRTAIIAALSSAPLVGLAVAQYRADTHANPLGLVVLAGFFALGAHGFFHNAVTRWALWGVALSPLYSIPASLALLTATVGSSS